MVMRLSHPTHLPTTALKAVSRLLALRGAPRRVVVAGDSMQTAFAPGDRLLVARAKEVKVGDVIALTDPRDRTRVLVKRVSATGPHGIEVLGDHAPASTDSRHFGPVHPSAVLGTAFYRYHPPSRSGWIGE